MHHVSGRGQLLRRAYASNVVRPILFSYVGQMVSRVPMPWPLFVGSVALLVLFPGFFLYHYGAAQGLYGLFLGGMFGQAVLALIGPLLFATITRVSRAPRVIQSSGALLFLALLTWSLIWLGINYVVSPKHPGHEELAATLVMWVALMCLGFLLPLRSRPFITLLRATWALMMIVALASTDISQLRFLATSAEDVASYSQMARSVFIVSAIVVVTSQSIRVRLPAALLSVVVLFLIGARSELYGFVAGYALVEFLINRDSAFGRVMLALSVIGGLSAIAANLEMLQASRQLEILNLSESSSWIARDYIQQQAWGQILESPIFGIYAGHFVFGEGNYAHNALSAWVSLGLPGFAIYLALCVISAWVSTQALMRSPGNSYAQLATLLSIPVLILVIIAKPVYWELPPLAWALAIVAGSERYGRIQIVRATPVRNTFAGHG